MWACDDQRARETARQPIAHELLVRLDRALTDGADANAVAWLFMFAGLWRKDPTAFAASAAQLQRALPVLRNARAQFAQRGELAAAALSLALLSELHDGPPLDRELAEILAFADQLAMAEHGALAAHSRGVSVLTPIVREWPHPMLVTTWLGLNSRRIAFVNDMLRERRPSYEVAAAHGDALGTARQMAFVLARAGRAHEIASRVSQLTGIGADRALVSAATAALPPQATPATVEALAELLADPDDNRQRDELAAASACSQLTQAWQCVRFAAEAGYLAQPLAWLEGALTTAQVPTADHAQVAGQRLGLALATIARQANLGRPMQAEQAFAALAAKPFGGAPSPAEVAEAKAALGRGYLRIGDAERGLTLLQQAATLDEANPAITESLGLALLAAHQPAIALRQAERGMALLDEERGSRYARARLASLAAEAARQLRRPPPELEQRRLEAEKQWHALGGDRSLSADVAGERNLALARLAWFAGHGSRARQYAQQAAATGPGNAGLRARAIAFLLLADAPNAAHDVLVAAARARGVSAPMRTYWALWLAVDARVRGHRLTDEVADILRSAGKDRSWVGQLAQAALGTRTFRSLETLATSRGRAIELAFYRSAFATPRDTQTLARVAALALPEFAEVDFANALLGRSPLSVLPPATAP